MAKAVSKEFLKLWSFRQAYEQGVNVNDKNRHALITEIGKLSTLHNAKDHKLYNIGIEVDGAQHISEEDLRRELTFLIENKLILQLFYFTYHREQKAVHAEACYLALPEAGGDIKLDKLYEAVVAESVGAVKELLSGRASMSRNEMIEIFNDDLRVEHGKGESFKSPLLFQLRELLESNSFGTQPRKDVIKAILHDLKEDLVRMGACIEIPCYGLLALPRDQLLDLVEAAREFLKQQLLARFKHNVDLNRQLEEIFLLEALHFEEPGAPDTMQFAVMRAEAVRPVLQRDGGGSGKPYSGGLAIETIMVSADVIDQKLSERHRQKIDREHRELKEVLTTPVNHWSKLVATYSQQEIDKLGLELWRRLRDDAELVYIQWEVGPSTLHCLAARDEATFRQCVESMSTAPPPERWKILVLKSLIEEAEETIGRIFKDKTFVKTYGKLLRIAYLEHMPFYIRPFVVLGIGFIVDIGFRMAKANIEAQQKRLGRRNAQRVMAETRNREDERKRRQSKLRHLELRNQIVEKLDYFYNQEKLVPTMNDLQTSLGSIKTEDLKSTLKNHNFQILQLNKSDDWSAHIPLFPFDQHWRSIATRTRKNIEERIKSLSVQSPLSDEQSLEKERAELVVKKIAKSL